MLTTAQEGDTILIAPGDCTISNLVFINRAISFNVAGSGTNQTTLRSPNAVSMFFWESNGTNTVAIHDLNIVGSVGNQSGCLYCGYSAFEQKGSYHVYNIQMTNVAGRAITMGSGKSKPSVGLIDHCNMKAVTGYLQFISYEGAIYGSWTNANPQGTTNVTCVEDCYFDDSAQIIGNGYFDSYNGAQLVFRHNFCIGYSPFGGHGYDSGDVGVRSWEVYNNIITNWNQAGGQLAQWRAGSGLVYSNKIYGANLAIMNILEYYRACPISHSYGSHTGYLPEGQPGNSYTVNFSNLTNYLTGCGDTYPGNPTNGQTLLLGWTTYTFVSALANATAGMANINGFGGGAVLIGASTAETITNLYHAVNLVPGSYGTNYTNFGGAAFNIGHDFIAKGFDSSNLYLTNALDGNTDIYGYPANQQQGVVQSFPLTGTNFSNNQTLFACYGWSNTVNGTNMSAFNTLTYATNCNYNITNLVKLGRDYFNDVIPATNLYQPLVYPHPLQSQEAGSAVIAAVPTSLNFGSLLPGTTSSLTFYVTNTGNAVLSSGSASVPSPYSITGSADYSGLAPGAAQTITVKYTPSTVGSDVQTVTLTGGGGATVAVSGYALPFTTVISGTTTISGNTVIK